MKQLSFLIILSIASAASPFVVTAQVSTAPQKPVTLPREPTEKQKQDDLKRAKAVTLIEQTAGDAALWNDREAAVSALSQSSDLLWDENPNARAWLTRAWDLIDKVEGRDNPEQLKPFWRGSQRSRLRTRVLNVALRHDGALAECFLQKLEQGQEEDKADRGAFDDRTARSEQLLRLAIKACETNPELAFNLAESSLRDGISFNLQTVLLQLRQKNPALANRLFDRALARLATSPAAFSESQILASYLFQPGQVIARLPEGAVTVAVVQTQLPAQSPAQSDPARARSFLTVMQRILLSAPLAEGQSQLTEEFILLTNSLATPFQIHAADLWPAIQVRRAQFAASTQVVASNASTAVSEKLRETETDGASSEEIGRLNVDALEERAAKEFDPIARKLKFAEAALATAPKNLERGKNLAGKIENDDDLRGQVITFLYYRAALTFFAENNLRKAEETALQIPSSLERSLALIAIAQKLAASKTPSAGNEWPPEIARQHAIELLSEADKSLNRADASTNIAKVRLGKTAVSHLIDTSQALIDFEQAIGVINRLERFDPTDEGIPRLGLEAFGATKLTVPRVNYGFGFRGALAPLVSDDFDRAATAIDGLASPSVRGLCRLEAARQVLHALPLLSNQMRTAHRQNDGKQKAVALSSKQ